MNSFRALRIHDEQGNVRAGIEHLRLDDLSAGDVVIQAAYSSVNYKDALAATGRGKIVRRFPLVGGIDVSGVVFSSSREQFQPGDPVLVTGCGLGEVYDGGYAEYVRVPAECVIPLPPGLSLFDAMAMGTPAFTAALALHRMEENGQRPELGPILVTGASGGVGNFAIDMFAAQGYELVVVTGKTDANDYLKALGASEIIARQSLQLDGRPLEKSLWGGAVDTVGGKMLGWLTRTVRAWGNIASIGLAGGSELHTTVMPFILRGVSLLGISSANCPASLRRQIWTRLAGDLRPRHLDLITQKTLRLDELMEEFDRMLAGNSRGRVVVQIASTTKLKP